MQFAKPHIFLILSLFVSVVFALSFGVFTTNAAPNYQINYQGKLTNASNVAVADGTYNMRFWLLTSSSIATTSAVWTESLTGTNKVQVTNGVFSVMLGSTSPLTGVDFNRTLYLGVEIGGTGAAAWDGEMSPRKILGAVPAAFEADNASTVGGVASTSLLRSDEADTASGLLTFTGGIISTASSTIANLTTLTATTTTFIINSESFTDLTGSGLLNTAGVLTCATATGGVFGCLASADWTVFNNKVSSSSIDTLDEIETLAGVTNILLEEDIDASSELLAIMDDETGTGLLVFATNPLLSGFRSNASSTIGDGTGTGGLTISGTASTTNLVITSITGSTQCLQVNSNGVVSGTGTACGAGGGGGGGTWATTTSLVSGQLINYSLNTTDVVAVGANSTTTAEYWFDPNAGVSYLSGKVGLGTSTPSSILDIYKTGLTGSVIAGVRESFTFANNTESAVYYGDNAYIVNAPTATSTLVGNMIRIEDSSAYGNTVRGLEVQAHRGTNTKGENTALSGYARTFGVRGTTEGDAGVVARPAGVFAETRGTTQGNALRAYSGSITTEALVSILQDTSTFAGTALLVNAGASGGTFASTSSRLIDLQKNGVSQFNVLHNGYTGIGTTTPSRALTVVGDAWVQNFTATGTASVANLLATGSSTIGGGTGATGLTINGGATTTGSLTLSAFTGGILTTNGSGVVSASTTVGSSYLDSAIILSTEIDTLAEIETLAGVTNILLEEDIDASSELLAIMDDETGTGLLVFATNPLLSGFRSNASSTIGDGTATGGLTVSGNSTTTGDVYVTGKIGIASTTPSRTLTVSGEGYFANNVTFSSTTASFASSTNASSTSLTLFGQLYDRTSSAGTNGMVLQTNGSGVTWVATSSLGITAGASTLDGLSDVDTTGVSTSNILAFDGTNWVDTSTSTFIMQDEIDTLAEIETLAGVTNILLEEDIDASSELLAIMDDETGTGLLVFATNPLLSGFRSNASSTIGGGSTSTGLTIDGGATTTGRAYFAGNVGIGTNTASNKLNISGTFAGADNALVKITNSGNGGVLDVYNADGAPSTYILFSMTVDNSADKLFGGSLSGDTYGRVLMTLPGLEWGAGTTARDVRFYRNAASVVTIDNVSGGAANLIVTGKIGIASTTPSRTLTVSGEGYFANNVTFSSTTASFASSTNASSTSLTLFGQLYDRTSSAGTNGMVLQTNGSGVTWVATSSLGITAGASTLDGLSDVDTTGVSTSNILSYNGTNWVDTSTSTFIMQDEIDTLAEIETLAGVTNILLEEDIDASSELAAIMDDETGTGLLVFATNPLLSGFRSNASSTIGDGTATGGLTVSGNSTTTGDSFIRGMLGVSTTPTYTLDVGVNQNAQSARFNGTVSIGVGSGPSNNTNNPLYVQGQYSQFTIFASASAADTSSLLLYQGAGSNSVGIHAVGTTRDLLLETTVGHILLSPVAGKNVGIGTTSPNAKLSISQGVGGTGALFQIASSSNGTATTTHFIVDAFGNVGIGSTSPMSQLALHKTGLTGSLNGGITEYLNFVNSSASAVYYGDNAYIVNAPTATSTLVGKMIRVEDSTALGNTVRGLEVQAHRGTNTKGENTALSGFGRTFGVRGTTIGDAGNTFLPAGVFAETQGTTQGNAFRAYSGTITTEDLVSLFHDTSNFAGTGIQMDFGNSGGSFAATSSAKFLDFKTAGTSKFIVSANGSTTIGDGVVKASLQVPFGGICVDNDGSCNASTTGLISSVTTATGNSDLAEMYFSSQALSAGDIVSLSGGLSVRRAEEGDAGTIVGVVSTKPGLLLGYDDVSLSQGESGYPIGLKGRVPIKLSTENGPIKKGDQITVSSIPGVGMKATGNDRVVGTALEDFDGERAYSATFLNQFGDDMARQKMVKKEVKGDVRMQDGCYNGGGSALGEEECDPKKMKNTVYVAVDDTSREAALASLASEPAVTKTVNGETVEVGQAVMFIELGWYQNATTTTMLAELLDPEIVENGDGTETLWDRIKTLAQNFVDGVLAVTGIKADRVDVAEELCIDDVCVTADDLRALLNGTNGNSNPQEEEEPADEEPDGAEESGTGSSEGGVGGGENTPLDTTLTDEGPIEEPPVTVEPVEDPEPPDEAEPDTGPEESSEPIPESAPEETPTP